MPLQPTIVGKVRTLWTGVGASLLKDVPFAALYWSLLEPVKGALRKSEVFDGAPKSKVNMAPPYPPDVSSHTSHVTDFPLFAKHVVLLYSLH